MQALSKAINLHEERRLYTGVVDVPANSDDMESVTLNEFSGLDKLQQLACKHFFEPETIEKLVKEKEGSAQCPLCKTLIDTRSIKDLESVATIIDGEEADIKLYNEEDGKEHMKKVKASEVEGPENAKQAVKRFVCVKEYVGVRPSLKRIASSTIIKVIAMPFNGLHWGIYAALRLATKISLIAMLILKYIGGMLALVAALVISPLVIPFSINRDPALGGCLNFDRIMQNALIPVGICGSPLIVSWLILDKLTTKLDKFVVSLKPGHTPQGIWRNGLAASHIHRPGHP